MNRNQNYALELIQECVGPDDNGLHEPGRFASWIHEDDATNNTASISDEEIAAIALAHGYKVYWTEDGYYGSEDYLIIDPRFTLEKVLRAWNDDIRDQSGIGEAVHVEDFKPVTLKDLFSWDFTNSAGTI